MSRGLKFTVVVAIALATNIGLRIGFGNKYCTNNKWQHCTATETNCFKGSANNDTVK